MNEEVKLVYNILKQYIPQKDLQTAVDHLADDLQEVMDEQEMYALARIDKYFKSAVDDLLGEEDDFGYDDEDEY